MTTRPAKELYVGPWAVGVVVISRVWSRLLATPYEVPVAVLVLLYGVLHLVGHRSPPGSLDAVTYIAVGHLWSVAVISGGIATMVGRFTDRTRMELAGQLLLGYSLLVYAAALLVFYNPDRSFAIAMHLGFGVGALVRSIVLRKALQGTD